MKYMIERLGDISGKTFHNTHAEAFAQLEKEYPELENTKGFHQIDKLVKQGKTKEIMELYWGSNLEDFSPTRETPDPEDDRILIWEITNEGHSKVIWHFSGWHWDSDCSDLVDGGLPQGKLPNATESLYKLAIG